MRAANFSKVIFGSLLMLLSFQAHADDCLQIGQEVVAVDSVKDVTIIAIENDGTYVVRDESGNIYSNIGASDLAPKQGCYSNLCVGQQVIALDSSKEVYLIALQSSDAFVVQDSDGNRYANITIDDLAPQAGCNGDICVGTEVIAVDSVKDVYVIAAESNGNFVVRDESGNTYSNIERNDLALMSGCSGNFCVGATVIALDSNKYVTIIAIEIDGTFVVRDQSGNEYANIGASDLAITQPTPFPGGDNDDHHDGFGLQGGGQ